KIRKNNPLID
ncbi:dicarboxylate symporter family protein, partial [Vibrio parahaemolyticus V-223/04]